MLRSFSSVSEALPFRQPDILHYSTLIADSFRHWTGRDLIASAAEEAQARALYHAPFVLLSHTHQANPVFCYANLMAQELWRLSWDQFMGMESRLSAEEDAREERQRLLQQAELQGYVDHYRGIRITSDGRRFRIKDCLLWNVVNKSHDKIGQAATFSSWEWI
jgi:hypothetical protein